MEIGDGHRGFGIPRDIIIPPFQFNRLLTLTHTVTPIDTDQPRPVVGTDSLVGQLVIKNQMAINPRLYLGNTLRRGLVGGAALIVGGGVGSGLIEKIYFRVGRLPGDLAPATDNGYRVIFDFGDVVLPKRGVLVIDVSVEVC